VAQTRISKTGAELFKRLVIPGDGDEMLAKCETERIKARATQIGANHVWDVFGRELLLPLRQRQAGRTWVRPHRSAAR
jgi:hypothetical protein